MRKMLVQSAKETKPDGWLKAQMSKDLTQGYVGCLDKLLPDLFANDDIYGENRRGHTVLQQNLGLAKSETIDPVHLQWWNSETQSQWYDGFIRHAFMLDSQADITACDEYVKRMLSYADSRIGDPKNDGYMGIYEKGARFQLKHESGELWAQATLFRALIGYYEMTDNEDVISAVIKAVDVTMENYDVGSEKLFSCEQTHGLMLSDTLEYLYNLTKNKKYADYLEFLYIQFCSSDITMGFDALEKNILDPKYCPKCHGVHTYEHLRTLTSLAYMCDSPYYKALLAEYLKKLEPCITPSGGAIGDEWIFGRSADALNTGYEYCSLQELLHSYMLLLEKTGDISYADKIENIFLNAAQGARHPSEPSIAYLKADNSYSMEGLSQIQRDGIPHKPNVRYKYSPTHQEAAVCCVPNAGRIAPYYLHATWYKTENGLLKALYGASSFNTSFNETEVSITEKSDFPANGSMIFEISLSQPTEMELAFRIPAWCNRWNVESSRHYVESDHCIIFSSRWEHSETIRIDFHFDVQMHFDLRSDVYYTYGPLLLAMPLPHEEIVVKEFSEHNLREVCYRLSDETNVPDNLHADKRSIPIPQSPLNNRWQDLSFTIPIFDNTGKKTTAKLSPIGNTILRKATFAFKPIVDED